MALGHTLLDRQIARARIPVFDRAQQNVWKIVIHFEREYARLFGQDSGYAAAGRG